VGRRGEGGSVGGTPPASATRAACGSGSSARAARFAPGRFVVVRPYSSNTSWRLTVTFKKTPLPAISVYRPPTTRLSCLLVTQSTY
jgi:hypothetical protein